MTEPATITTSRRRRARPPRGRRRDRAAGFTLLEILIALGILAIGLTAVLGLLASAVATGKRAQNRVDAANLAESIVADIENDLDLSFDHDELDGLDPASNDDYRTRILRDWEPSRLHPSFKTRILITPITGPIDLPEEFLLEVHVDWSDRGKNRGIVYPASVLRTTSPRDRPAPPRSAVGS